MLIKCVRIPVFILLFLTQICPSFASNGTQLGIVGAKSTALGSAVRGMADDWSAIYFNPAGLTQTKSSWTFGTSVGVVMPTAEFTQNNYPLSETPSRSFPFSGLSTQMATATEQRFYIPSVAGVYRYSEDLVFGFGILTPFGLGTEWDLVDLPATYGNALNNEKELYSRLQVISFQPTVAYQWLDNLSVGMGLSVLYGSIQLDNVKLPYNPANRVWADMQERADLLGLGLTDLTTDQRRIGVENHLDSNGFGLGMNVGVHWQPGEKWKLGLSAQLYSRVKLEGDFKQTFNPYTDNDKVHTLTQIPAEYYADCHDQTGEVHKQYYIGLFNGEDYSTSDAKKSIAKLPLPATVGFGVAYHPWTRWDFLLDLSWTNWSVWDEVEIKSGDNELAELKLDWEDTYQAGLGIQWFNWDAKKHDMFLRLGYYYTKTPIPFATMTPVILDPKERHVITGGFGFDFWKVSLNLTGEYVLFHEDQEVPTYQFDPLTGVAHNYAGLYKADAMVFTFGMSYLIP